MEDKKQTRIPGRFPAARIVPGQRLAARWLRRVTEVAINVGARSDTEGSAHSGEPPGPAPECSKGTRGKHPVAGRGEPERGLTGIPPVQRHDRHETVAGAVGGEPVADRRSDPVTGGKPGSSEGRRPDRSRPGPVGDEASAGSDREARTGAMLAGRRQRHARP